MKCPRLRSQSKPLKRTVVIAAILAVAASIPFYFWVSRDARNEQRAFSRASTLTLMRASLIAKQAASGVAVLEADGALKKLPSPSELHVEVRSRTGDVALVTPVAQLATTPPVPLVTRDDSPMADPDDDAWLLRLPDSVVSLRALERRVVTLLIAAYDKPDLCPTAIRIQGGTELGKRIDGRFAASLTKLVPRPEALDPLCRRERQRRLAEAELDTKEKHLGITSGIFVRPIDRFTQGVGGKAALLLQGMVAADELWEPRTLGEAIPVLLGQLAYEDAIIAAAYRTRALVPSPTLLSIAHRLSPQLENEVALEACALSAALAQSLDQRRFVSELIGAYLSEHWPAEPRRSGALSLLYALSEEAIPKEAAASPERLQFFLDVVQTKPLCAPYTAQPAIPQALPKETLQQLTNGLDRSVHIL